MSRMGAWDYYLAVKTAIKMFKEGSSIRSVSMATGMSRRTVKQVYAQYATRVPAVETVQVERIAETVGDKPSRVFMLGDTVTWKGAPVRVRKVNEDGTVEIQMGGLGRIRIVPD